MKIFPVVFSIFLSLSVYAQTAEEILDKAVAAHQRYDLLEAQTLLAQVEDVRAELSRVEKGRYMYYSARNGQRLLTEKYGGDEGSYVSLQAQQEVYDVYQQLLKLSNADIPRWSEKAHNESMQLFELLVRAGVECLEALSRKEMDASLLENISSGYNNLAATIRPKHYTPHELQGQLHFALKAESKALRSLNKALGLYRQNRFIMLDNIRMPYVYYLLATSAVEESELDSALVLCQEGYSRNAVEWKTLQSNKQRFGHINVLEQKPIYEQNQRLLGLLELELLAQLHPQDDSTLIKFEERRDYFRKEFSFHYNYAGLLEDLSPRRASFHYQKAIDIDSTAMAAYYHMGMLYANTADEYMLEARKLKGKDKKDLQLKAFQMYQVGLPYLKRAHVLVPNNLPTLRNLTRICQILGQDDLASDYKNKIEKILRG